MDYISMEDWCELSKWLEISQGFYEAYTRFRLEGTEVHWMSFNFCDKCIEVVFSYLDSSYDQIDVMVYCPDVEKKFYEPFFLDENEYRNEKRITQEIIAIIYRLAWGSLEPEVFKITTVDSNKALQQIRTILIEKEYQCTDGSIESACLFGESSVKCIIELYGRKILLDVSEDQADWFIISLDCKDMGRQWLQVDKDTGTFQEIVEKVLYLALEPEVFQISTNDSEWEYELIRTNVMALCPMGKGDVEERILVLHGRQIKIQFQPTDDGEIAAHLECTTTDRSTSCTVDPYDKNPQELIWKIQELAWEDDYRRYPMEIFEIQGYVEGSYEGLSKEDRERAFDVLFSIDDILDQMFVVALDRQRQPVKFQIIINAVPINCQYQVIDDNMRFFAENAASGRNDYYYFMCDIDNPDSSILEDDIVEARVVTTKLIASSSSV